MAKDEEVTPAFPYEYVCMIAQTYLPQFNFESLNVSAHQNQQSALLKINSWGAKNQR